MNGPFIHGHATHPDWRMAVALAAAQIDAQWGASEPGAAPQPPPTLGFAYLTDTYAPHAQALLADLHRRWPGTAWVGAVGVGVCASGVEYFGEPAVALMLTTLSRQHFRVFSGVQPLPADFHAHTALVHADPGTHEVDELIGEMSERVSSGYLFGGLAAARRSVPGQPMLIADACLSGGLSGVAFDASVTLVSRVTQGCQPIGPTRTVTAAERNVVMALDGQPALTALLADLGTTVADLRSALPRLQQTLVGLSDSTPGAATAGHTDTTATPAPRKAHFGTDVRVRHLVGLDPARNAFAIGDNAPVGTRLSFCTRGVEAARRDLVRMCAELREEIEPEHLPYATAVSLAARADNATHGFETPASRHIAGAIYVSCSGRGGPHFGAPSAELTIVRRALGDVPLVGFFAAGEIAHRHLYGYTGVLTVFTTGA